MTRRWLSVCALLLLAGCTAEGPMLPSAPLVGSRLGLQPAGELDQAPATLHVGLRLAPWTVQTLPTAWDTATLRLEHPIAMTQPRLRTLAKGGGLVASGSSYVATSAFGGILRPRGGYVLTVSLWNGGAHATLVAEKQVTANLVAGTNALTVPLEVYPALGLASFSPATGSFGTAVTLSGQGFSVLPSLTQVSLGAAGDMQSLTPTSLASTSLTASVPNTMGPGAKTWQVKVGSSLAARSGFTLVGTLGSPFVASSAGSQQQDPALAFGGGQYLAAWTDSRPASGAGIYARRLDAGGTVLGSDLVIASAAQPYVKPAMAYDSTHNRFLVVFESNDTILGQLVNADGTLQGGTIPIAAASGTRTDARVAFDSTNQRYLVVWTDARSGTLQIYGQRLTATGGLIGGNAALVSGAVAQSRSQVAYSAIANAFLVVNTGQTTPQRIMGRVVNPDGTFGSAVLTIATGSGNQMDPAVAADPVTGDFFVAWDSAVTGFRDSVLGQRVSGTGALVGSPVTINAFSSLKEAVHLAHEPARGTFLVTWGDNRGTDTDLFGTHVALNGTLWGSEFPVVAGSNAQAKGEVAVDAGNRRGLVLYEETAGATKKVSGQLTYH